EYNAKFSYTDNRIKTSKYNIFTFLPVNLFEQLQRVANAYFIVLLILQSSDFMYCRIFQVYFNCIFQFRHRSDQNVNNRQSQVLIRGRYFRNEKWMNVRVGDIIKLENNQFVTADILLLCSSEPYGLCYVETSELDGETNLKVRQALTVTSELTDISKLVKFNGEVICEPPNNKLDKFTGTLFWRDCKYPLDNGKMLLRGCTLRNTEWCFGMVIFAGLQTKLMQNCGKTIFKRTSIDKLMNTLVLWVSVFQWACDIYDEFHQKVEITEVGFRYRLYRIKNIYTNY
uniref:P-type ATPase N-terminal domain-containing protein n=1 Tax=Neogobius melanostomus TaxID=47308 RepID=A0A8C6WT98_9GOBI